MRQWRTWLADRSSLSHDDETALAGSALACTFSCSDEFEAAVINQRRAAGQYRRAVSPRQQVAAACALFVLLFFLFAYL